MAVFKCKMCGGDLNIEDGVTVAACDYCGTKQTLPSAKDDNLQTLFNRANTLRFKGESDKAEKLYEKILSVDEAQAEAYWGLILCKYGIEYVEDPVTFNRVPTCHRASFDSIVADEDYKSALKYADGVQHSVYEAEAVEIDRIQKEILLLSQKEEPYDVFICYKETDENGKRTQDSVIANDIYHQLTQEGFKVFYAAITLEDKLGSAYEPCIFAALNSAKVMLAIGTKPSFFNAVWVKNEWSRYLKLMKNDRSRILIPCYKDMDAYELPEEFAHLQAQDMSKIGFINDVVRGIKKVLDVAPAETAKTEAPVQTTAVANIDVLLERVFMFLEDADWQSADEYCEKVLDMDPKCAKAYLGKLMAELRIKNAENLSDCPHDFENSGNYNKVIRFGDKDLAETISGYLAAAKEKIHTDYMDELFDNALADFTNAQTVEDFNNAEARFAKISGWKNADEMCEKCKAGAENIIATENNKIYDEAVALLNRPNNIAAVQRAQTLFNKIPDWRDSEAKIQECAEKAQHLREQSEKQSKRENRKAALWGVVAVVLCIAVVSGIVIADQVGQSKTYNNAIALMESGSYSEAIEEFEKVHQYKDSISKISECGFLIKYDAANALVAEGKLYEAIRAYDEIKGFRDSAEKSDECKATLSEKFVGLMKNENRISARNNFITCVTSYGAVVINGGNSETEIEEVLGWTDIIAVAVGSDYTVGLKADGKVVSTGFAYGYAMSGWTDIVEISVDENNVVGLKNDGSVVATGPEAYGVCNVSDWENIVAIEANNYHTFGLKKDGTVVMTERENSMYDKCDVSAWKDIVAIAADGDFAVGLKSDGTLVTTGTLPSGFGEVTDWTDIKAIAVSEDNIVGLKTDNTLSVFGSTYYGQSSATNWTDVVTVYTAGDYIIAVQSDGSVVSTNSSWYVLGWDLF